MASEKDLKSLLIVSDTPFYRDKNSIRVFEPTLREVEEISDMFKNILWISYNRGSNLPGNAREPKIHNIKLIALPDFRGGIGIISKLKVVCSLPFQIVFIAKYLLKFPIVHTRGPSVPAFIVLLGSFVIRKPVYWFKYAGNWVEMKSPVSFRLQRRFLERQRYSKFHITLNGNWPGLHRGFLNWENPCLNTDEWHKASQVKKDFSGKFRICFVGNLDPFKGALRLVTALASPALSSIVEGIWIVGDGPEQSALRDFCKKLPFDIHLMGYMSRSDIFLSIYSTCHFLVLPSESEGFPKVVAEAAAHRCIPVTTRVSAIDQYVVHGRNGFLLPNSSVESITETFVKDIIYQDPLFLESVANEASRLSSLFTYEDFRKKIKEFILTSGSQ